ncbi:MAG TPA: glutaminyl-peptide cyclotransferase [Bryobacteraceae bacterium]|nr:glutaminyl-peptide cyclotransferase [Bryobacteraceae bacterium]
MRVLIGIVSACLFCAAAPSDASPVKKSHSKIPGPKNGVRLPGVQIPFARLKPDATVAAPAKPEWIFFSNSVFFAGADRIERVDAKTTKLMEPVAGVKKPCGGMASAFGSVWAVSCGDGSLVKIDGKAGKVTATLQRGASGIPGSIAATDDSIWMLLDEETTLARVDPDQMMIVATMRLPEGCRSMVSAEKSLWIACPGENKIYRINPDTNLVDKRIDTGAEPAALAFGEGSIWAFCRKEGKLDRIDPKTNKVTKTIDLGAPGARAQMAVGDGSVWVTMTGFPITRIDPKDESVPQQFWGTGGGAIATSEGAIWLSNLNDGTLWRIDPNLIKATVAE